MSKNKRLCIDSAYSLSQSALMLVQATKQVLKNKDIDGMIAMHELWLNFAMVLDPPQTEESEPSKSQPLGFATYERLETEEEEEYEDG